MFSNFFLSLQYECQQKKVSQAIGTMSQQLDVYNRGTEEEPILHYRGGPSSEGEIGMRAKKQAKRAVEKAINIAVEVGGPII